MSDLIFESYKPWLIVRFASNALTDAHHIERMNEQLKQQIDALPLRPMLLLNFRGVEFVSSQVIGLLLNAKSLVGQKSGTLKLCRISTKLREALEITGLMKQFSIADSETAVIGMRKKIERVAPATQRSVEVGWLD